jgi:hypothetical protein
VELVHIPLFVALGMALDWALFERADNAIRTFWEVQEGYSYRELLFPRAYVTMISSAIIGVGALDAPPNAPVIIAGSSLFLLANFYADYLILRYGRRR